MMDLPKIVDNFNRYVKGDLPENLDDEILAILCDAFFQGAGSTLWMIEKIARAGTPAEGIAALQVLREEYGRFEMSKVARELEKAIGKYFAGIAVVRVKVAE